MIGIAATTDDDERNDYGMPITANAPQNRGNFHQAVDQSVNKALPWVAFSWFLSGGAIIGLIVMAILVPSLIESGVAKGVAEARAAATQQVADAKIEIAQQVADAKAIASAGREHARVALDKVEQTQVQLGAKGLIKPSTH